MHATHTINDLHVKDPLSAYILEEYENAGRQFAKFRDAKTDNIASQSSFLMELVGSKLKVKAQNLLNHKAAWITTIQCRRRLGMLPSVCKPMSSDIKLRQMDKTYEDNLNAVVLQIKGANCDGEPAIGICFPEDEDACAVRKFLLGPNDKIVQIIGVLKKECSDVTVQCQIDWKLTSKCLWCPKVFA